VTLRDRAFIFDCTASSLGHDVSTPQQNCCGVLGRASVRKTFALVDKTNLLSSHFDSPLPDAVGFYWLEVDINNGRRWSQHEPVLATFYCSVQELIHSHLCKEYSRWISRSYILKSVEMQKGESHEITVVLLHGSPQKSESTPNSSAPTNNPRPVPFPRRFLLTLLQN
jgi:hypothetical protein